MSKATTPKFRVAFPNVFKARLNDLSKKEEFSLVALFPKGADLAPLKIAAENAMAKKFGPDKAKWPKGIRNPFRDQGDRAKTNDDGKEVLPQGYEKGAIYLNLKSNQRPGVVDQSVQPIIDSSEFYGGCFAIATVNAYAYDTAGNRGVSFGLANVQKISEGDVFGNRSKPEDDFAPVANTDVSNETSSNDLFN